MLESGLTLEGCFSQKPGFCIVRIYVYFFLSHNACMGKTGDAFIQIYAFV